MWHKLKRVYSFTKHWIANNLRLWLILMDYGIMRKCEKLFQVKEIKTA